MADWSLPTLADLYADFRQYLSDRLIDAALLFDSGLTTPTNLPVGAKRWNSSASKWEQWNGSAWADLAATYGINISGTAALATAAQTLTQNPGTYTHLGGWGLDTGAATTFLVNRAYRADRCDGNAASATVAASCSGNAASASTAFKLRSTAGDGAYNWSGQGGQPAWLWGSNDGVNFYVWNPANFSVNYANRCNYANSANSCNWATSAGYAPAPGTGAVGSYILTDGKPPWIFFFGGTWNLVRFQYSGVMQAPVLYFRVA